MHKKVVLVVVLGDTNVVAQVVLNNTGMDMDKGRKVNTVTNKNVNKEMHTRVITPGCEWVVSYSEYLPSLCTN